MENENKNIERTKLLGAVAAALSITEKREFKYCESIGKHVPNDERVISSIMIISSDDEQILFHEKKISLDDDKASRFMSIDEATALILPLYEKFPYLKDLLRKLKDTAQKRHGCLPERDVKEAIFDIVPGNLSDAEMVLVKQKKKIANN